MGFFYSLLAAATFGLTPFFSIPLMRSGLSPQSVLFYRFLTATVIMALILLPAAVFSRPAAATSPSWPG